MRFSKVKSVAFTGHRSVPYAQKGIVRFRLQNAVKKFYNNGYRIFYCGMAVGFDLLAAEVVLSLKEELKDIKLVAAVPFKKQYFKFSREDKKRYFEVLQKVDEVIILSEEYYKGCLLRRNDFMLENSSGLIAFYNGEQKGGTYYTCKRAEERRMPVLNIY